MRKKKYVMYIIAVWIVLLIPFAGMAFWPTNTTTENTKLAEWPAFKLDGRWNKAYLPQMGQYFEDHFAFRQYLVTANALLRSKTVKGGFTNQIILGKNDWLYYKGTLDDYQARNGLTDRGLFDVVHNLSLIQNYVQQQGSQFRLIIAPNKNSLYGGNMPYYYGRGRANNVDRLTPLLVKAGIQYVDLYKPFKENKDVLYFARDSHWNNKGALLAYNTLMDSLGKEHETYQNVPYEIKKVHTGDLDKMLYPLAARPEDDYFYEKEQGYAYVNDVKDNMDDWIQTRNPGKQGSLLMFRDSFGESLLPFVADEVGQGYFSRLVPYNLTQIEQLHPEYVVIERVERKLKDFAIQVPIMEGPQTEEISAPEARTHSTIKTERAGSYLSIKGTIDAAYMSNDAAIFVSVRNEETMETKTYNAFYTLTGTGKDNGYQLYLKGGSVPGGKLRINIIATDKGRSFIVAAKEIEWKDD